MQSAPPRSDIRKVPDAFLESPVDGELILLNVRTGTFDGLRDVGLAIWGLLDRTGDLAQIKAELCARYDIAPATCDREVDHFVQGLIDAGLLARFDAPTHPGRPAG